MGTYPPWERDLGYRFGTSITEGTHVGEGTGGGWGAYDVEWLPTSLWGIKKKVLSRGRAR